MSMRDRLAEYARTIADNLKIPEHIKALQDTRTDLRDALLALGERMTRVEARLDAIKSEATLSALRETHDVVGRVHGQIGERLSRVETELAVIRATLGAGRLEPPRAGR